MSPLPRLFSQAPRAYLFTRPAIHTRALSATPRSRLAASGGSSGDPGFGGFSPFAGPSPPRLPKEEQDVFEELQRRSTGAFSTPREKPRINQSPHSTPAETAAAQADADAPVDPVAASSVTPAPPESPFPETYGKVIEARGKGEELHPNVRRGAVPEFEGEVNPKTGEVGGPKNEPLRWGAGGEWSYNGRVTDF